MLVPFLLTPRLNHQPPNTALHRTPPPPCPVLGRVAVLAVSPVSYAVRLLNETRLRRYVKENLFLFQRWYAS
jgi:hypothetical protein